MPLFQRPDAAEQEFRKAAVYRNPKSKELDLKLALHHLKQAIALKPNDPKYHYELGFTYLQAPDLALRFGAKPGYKLSQSAEMAIAELETARKLKPDHLGAAANLVLAYCYLGQKKQALATAKSIKDKQGNKYATRLVEAQQKVGHDDVAEARRYLQEAVSYRSMGRSHEAEKEFQKGYTMLAYDLAELYRLMCEVAG